MTEDNSLHEQYLCPQCGSDGLRAEAVEHKTAYINADGEVYDEEPDYTDFEAFDCLKCSHHYRAEDELDRAINAMAAANAVVSTRLTRTEESMYYAVLDALGALREEQDGDG